MNKKKILVVAVLAYILLSILNGIADTRSNGNRTISDMLEGMSLGFTDTIGNFLGEMGWQLSSTSWTMQFMDHGYATPKYGLSYLTGFLVIIPNLGQWEVHPDELVNAGTWMQKLLNRKTGMGYSFIAESYYNFSWFGLLFLFVIGVCISKWLTAITVKNAKYNYKYMIIILMVFSTMLRPFIRSTFSASLRKLVYIVIASIFVMYMIKIFYKRYQNNNRGYHN